MDATKKTTEQQLDAIIAEHDLSVADIVVGARALHASLAEFGIGRGTEYDCYTREHKAELSLHVARILVAIR